MISVKLVLEIDKVSKYADPFTFAFQMMALYCFFKKTTKKVLLILSGLLLTLKLSVCFLQEGAWDCIINGTNIQERESYSFH